MDRTVLYSIRRSGTDMLFTHIRDTFSQPSIVNYPCWPYEKPNIYSCDRLIVLSRKNVFATVASLLLSINNGAFHTIVADGYPNWAIVHRANKSLPKNKTHGKNVDIKPIKLVDEFLSEHVYHYLDFFDELKNLNRSFEFYWYEDLVSNNACDKTAFIKNKVDKKMVITNYSHMENKYKDKYQDLIITAQNAFIDYCLTSKNVYYNKFILLKSTK